MIEIRNSETLQRWLLESGHLGRLWDRPRFLFDRAEFEREVAGVREQYPQFSADEAEARAALRLLGKEEGRSRALVVGKRRQWTRRERLFLIVVLLLAALLALLLCVPRARAQEFEAASRPGRDYVLGGPRPWGTFGLARGPYRADQIGGQPGGVIWYWQNDGSTLHTFAGGVGYVNCSTNLTCSYTANPPTITITASGGGSGSGCIPPGSTANALLFDAGSGTCSDVSKLTWSGSTLTGASGLTVDFSAASSLKLSGTNTSGLPGSSGQLLYNNGGNLGAEDPVVSGPDATGTAQSKNPVAGLAGVDYGTGCGGNPCVREAKVDSSGNVSVAVTNSPTVSVSGNVSVTGTFWQTTQPVSIATMPTTPVTGTFWQTTQPVSWSGQSVSLTGSWPYSGALGSVSVSNFPATQPVSGTVTANQGTAAALSGFWPVEITDGTHTMPTGDASARTIHVTADNSSIPVTGTFWQATQPVSEATLDAAISSNVVQENVKQIGGTAVVADPCQQAAGTSANINLTASGQIITGTSGKQTYICAFDIVTAAAQNIALVEGTGTTCGTSTAGMAGGTTAATGWNFAANGGLVKGTGAAWVYKTATTGDNVCLLLSGTGQTSGEVRYVQQ